MGWAETGEGEKGITLSPFCVLSRAVAVLWVDTESPIVAQRIRALRLSADHGAAAGSRLACSQGSSTTNLASGRVESAAETKAARETEFVFGHAEVVRRLPPRLPNAESSEQEGQEHRKEEIGAKLELPLRSIDQRLFELRQKAWRNVDGSVVGARLGMAGIRELLDEILRIFAPECDVETMPAWQDRTDRNITRPTRQIRLAYVLGEARAAEADALFQFDKSIKRTQKFVHTFADDVELVRAQMTHLEIWIHLLLHYGMQRSRSKPSQHSLRKGLACLPF